MFFEQVEIDYSGMNRQLEELKATNNKIAEANARSEQLKVEELQRKLKSETEVTTKLRKGIADHKKVSFVLFYFFSWLHVCMCVLLVKYITTRTVFIMCVYLHSCKVGDAKTLV